MTSKATHGLSSDRSEPTHGLPEGAGPTPSDKANLPDLDDILSDGIAPAISSLKIRNDPSCDALHPLEPLTCTEPSPDEAASCLDIKSPEPSVEPRDAAPSWHEIYAPLKEGQIRLVKLIERNSSQTRFRMRTVDLDSAPDYQALSYVCGDEPSDCEVEVNGHPFPIRPNLFAALQWLPIPSGKSSWARLLWIDAICINQLDDDEKALQVREMHRVFSGAKRVQISLGHLPPLAMLAFLALEWAYHLFILNSRLPKRWRPSRLPSSLDEVVWESGPEALDNRARKHTRVLATNARLLEARFDLRYTQLIAIAVFIGRHWISEFFSPTTGASRCFEDGLPVGLFVPENHSPPMSEAFWSGLNELLEVGWFRRVWTYQEAQVSKDASLLANGCWASFSWLFCRASVKTLLESVMGRQDAPFGLSQTQDQEMALRISLTQQRDFWHQFNDQSQVRPLLVILTYSGTRQAAVAKDHVYGFLGVLEPSVRASTTVSYTLPDSHVFAAAFKMCLKSHFTTTVRWFWSSYQEDTQTVGPRLEGLPSWCPDLRFCRQIIQVVRNKQISRAAHDKYRPYAQYQDFLKFDTIGVKVLKLERITRCMSTASPIGLDTFWQSPEGPVADDLFAALYTWRAEFDQFARGPDAETLRNHIDSKGKFVELAIREKFEALASKVLEPGPERAGLVSLCSIAYSQGHRYLFQTASGRSGYSGRQPVVGAAIVLVPGCRELQMLTPDSTGYIGCATVDGLEGDTLLDPPPDLDNEWEMVTLT